MAKSCIIIGGGIAGPAAALTLSRAGIHCHIYELRAHPSSIGAAINLTPSAVRLLRDLGVEVSGCPIRSMEVFSLHTAGKMGEMAFHAEPALRVLRGDVQTALLAAVARAEVPITYQAKLVALCEDGARIRAEFADGTSVVADLVVGGDGIHSTVRAQYVEPSRIPLYTGAAGMYSTVAASAIAAPIHFQDAALNFSRFGTVMTSFVDPARSQVYVAAVMEMDAHGERQGWRARQSDCQAIRTELNRRYERAEIPCVPELIKHMDGIFLYPVFKLGPKGRWHRGKAILIGDAAHAMPPQGESVGLALEDAVLLSRVFEEVPDKSISEVFAIYEATRRARINAAYAEATMRWEHVKDRGWLQQKLFEMMFAGILMFGQGRFAQKMKYDIREEPLRV